MEYAFVIYTVLFFVHVRTLCTFFRILGQKSGRVLVRDRQNSYSSFIHSGMTGRSDRWDRAFKTRETIIFSWRGTLSSMRRFQGKPLISRSYSHSVDTRVSKIFVFLLRTQMTLIKNPESALTFADWIRFLTLRFQTRQWRSCLDSGKYGVRRCSVIVHAC